MKEIKMKLLVILFLLKLYVHIDIFKLFRGNKYHFSLFLKCLLFIKYKKIEDTSFKFEYSDSY